MSGDFGVALDSMVTQAEEADALFSLADLDQKPRPVFRPLPKMDAKLKRKAPGKVVVIFIVDRNGRVKNPIVQRATDPAFKQPALDAIKKWKFEPGKRNGEAVQFRMRQPISFPKG